MSELKLYKKAITIAVARLEHIYHVECCDYSLAENYACPDINNKDMNDILDLARERI